MRKIVRKPAVLSATGDGNYVQLWRKIQKGLFPPPFPIGLRAVGWAEDEIELMIAARIAGFTDEELRALVKDIVARRKTAIRRPRLRAASEPIAIETSPP